MAEENNSTKQLEALKKSGRAHTKYAQKLIIAATLTATPLTVQANAQQQPDNTFNQETKTIYTDAPIVTESKIAETTKNGNIQSTVHFEQRTTVNGHTLISWEDAISDDKNNLQNLESGITLQTPDGQNYDISALQPHIDAAFEASLNNSERAPAVDGMKQTLASMPLPQEAQEAAVSCATISVENIAQRAKGEKEINAEVDSRTTTQKAVSGPDIAILQQMQKRSY